MNYGRKLPKRNIIFRFYSNLLARLGNTDFTTESWVNQLQQYFPSWLVQSAMYVDPLSLLQCLQIVVTVDCLEDDNPARWSGARLNVNLLLLS